MKRKSKIPGRAGQKPEKRIQKRAKNVKIKRLALVSAWDKTGLVKFVKSMQRLGFDIVSTGGTAEALKKAKIKVTEVAALTRYPHMLGGRVKSLHPLIHGGILADRSNPAHLKDMIKFNIRPIDMVVCNLYPFEKVMAKESFTHDEAIENIDIGGPAMTRAAAKNYKHVAIVVDPLDYSQVLDELKKNKGMLSHDTREKLAAKAFRRTAKYDAMIYEYLSSRELKEKNAFPAMAELSFEKIQDLRYGENPHQKASFYRQIVPITKGKGITEGKQLHGKELSFNNIVDVDSAWQVATYFSDPTVVVVKHNNPCGVGQDKDLSKAYKKAFAGDPVSAYGGIIAANREIDGKTVKEIGDLFVECIIAPGYSPDALKTLKQKKNLRIISMGKESVANLFRGLDYKRVSGGLLVQDADNAQLGINDIKIVTKREPTIGELEDLFFAWGVAKHVKSNAIVLVKNNQVLGVGAGQMSRIDAAELAIKKAGKDVKGAVLASDAFFPFQDVVELAAKHGIGAIIQPGGSIRDQLSIDAANQNNIAMVFTGRRHFRH